MFQVWYYQCMYVKVTLILNSRYILHLDVYINIVFGNNQSFTPTAMWSYDAFESETPTTHSHVTESKLSFVVFILYSKVDIHVVSWQIHTQSASNEPRIKFTLNSCCMIYSQ